MLVWSPTISVFSVFVKTRAKWLEAIFEQNPPKFQMDDLERRPKNNRLAFRASGEEVSAAFFNISVFYAWFAEDEGC
jgi:hypothetical protein